MKTAIVILLVGAAAGVARAELPVQARGSATITGGDAATAKARALDDAMRQAVDQAAATLLAAEERQVSPDLVKKRILRRARTYVLRYKIVSEGEEEGVYAVTLDATVADAPLAADLRALGGGAPAVRGEAPPPRPGRPALALLALTREGDQTFATFGRAASEPGPVAPALERELAARGFQLVPAVGLDVPVSAEPGAGLPLDVMQATELARRAGAGGVLVAAATVKDGGRIRGTRRAGAEVELRVRLDDVVEGARVAEAQVQAAGHGPDVSAAAVAAGRSAAASVGRQIGKRLESRWPPSDGPPSVQGVLVRLRGVLRGPDVDAIARALAGGAGVRGVVLHRLARREVVLLVKGARDVRALAGVAAATPLAGGRITAHAAGGEVAVEVAADVLQPPPIATPP